MCICVVNVQCVCEKVSVCESVVYMCEYLCSECAYVCECSECVHVCECVCVVSIYVVNVQCEYLCSECVNVCVSVVGACVSVCVFTHHQPYIHILIVMPSTTNGMEPYMCNIPSLHP